MFFERDYILRMIQMMGDFFRRLAEKLDAQERAALIDEECERHCGMPMKTARELSAQSLTELLPKEPRFLMGELLYISAELAPMGERESLLHKALTLLCSLYGDPEVCQARAERLSQIKQELLDALTAPELMACARFFYEGESYAEMEDAIFQAVERAASGEMEDMLDRGLRLLSDATEASLEALALCGLTREELEQSIQSLTAISQLIQR